MTRHNIPAAQMYHHQDRSGSAVEMTLAAVKGEGNGRRFVTRTMDRMPMLLLRTRTAASLRCGLRKLIDLEKKDGEAERFAEMAITMRL